MRGRSRPILGRATLTTVESRNTIPDPRTAAKRIQNLLRLMTTPSLGEKRSRVLCASFLVELGGRLLWVWVREKRYTAVTLFRTYPFGGNHVISTSRKDR